MPRASRTGVTGLYVDEDGRYRIDLRWTEGNGLRRRHKARLAPGTSEEDARACAGRARADMALRIVAAQSVARPALGARTSEVPSVVGVYILLLAGVVVYVGQSVNVPARLRAHRAGGVVAFDDAVFIPCAKKDLKRLEGERIAALRPTHNLMHNPGASHRRRWKRSRAASAAAREVADKARIRKALDRAARWLARMPGGSDGTGVEK